MRACSAFDQDICSAAGASIPEKTFILLIFLGTLMHIDTLTADSCDTTSNDRYRQQQELYRIYSAIGAPASKPALHFVIANLNRCLDRIFVSEPKLAVFWTTLRTAVGR